MENKCYFEVDIDFSDDTEREKCFKNFSETADGNPSIIFNNFKDLTKNILTDSKENAYDVTDEMLKELFTTFDVNGDGKIDAVEFILVWNDFIKPLVRPVTALLVIDVQNDFINGSLAIKDCPAKQDGKNTIPVINNLMENFKFHIVAYTLDCHPEDHISFLKNIELYKLNEKNKPMSEIELFDTVIFEGPPVMSQILWPVHCIQNSWGCKLHKDLKICEDSLFIYKGLNSKMDSYSAFLDNLKISSTVLDEELRKRSVSHVFVCGVALDYCVACTTLDALELGYAATIIEDATAGTDYDNIKAEKKKLVSRDCVFTNSEEVESLITGKNRKVEFASIFLKSLKRKLNKTNNTH